MPLLETFNQSGNWLFKNRSFIPLILYPVAAVCILIESVHIFYTPDLLWSVICFFISLTGLFIRTLVIGSVHKGTSGRNTKQQIANILNTKGIYSIVRHPLYLGNFLMWFGLVVYTGSTWFMIMAALLFWLYYERIMFAEETYLRNKFGRDFEIWAEKTPAFIPALKKWKKPELKFSLKKAIRREYRGLFAVILSFVFLNLLKNYAVYQSLKISTHWIMLLIIGFIFFITVHILNKKTNLLKPKTDQARSI